MSVDQPCENCSSAQQQLVFHDVYPGLCYEFRPPRRLGVETRAQRLKREESEALMQSRESQYGRNFENYSVTDIDNIHCKTFLTSWLLAIPTSPITHEADARYNELLIERIIYRMNSLDAND